MSSISITTLLSIVLPALITGGIAYYFFQMYFTNENKRRNFLLVKESKKQSLPIRLQAYERITLFLERVSPTNLLTRIKPLGNEKEDYLSLVIATITQEYEHNLSQQIYFSEECWNVVTTSKNTTIQVLKQVASDEKIETSYALREAVMMRFLNTTPPSSVALSFVKKEVLELL